MSYVDQAFCNDADLGPLFDRARRSDPETSKQAAFEIGSVLGNRCNEFLTALKKLGRATANEVAEQVAAGDHRKYESIRRRASDLAKKGIIRVLGTRRCTITSKPATYYEINTDRLGAKNVNGN
jgi:predicted transcriptional regulator